MQPRRWESDRALGDLLWPIQKWLQGWPDKRRPWAIAWLGNRVSDARYHLWLMHGGDER